ncbi:PP2C family protein-serine/threonine phosphatase [Streptomyces sp. NPDC006422]|uniref:PP2C family protein-serine/threonine phosphatase n=1 Tax=unclassified Streptomyces TaxID=2593676 RepID=UPI00339E0D44
MRLLSALRRADHIREIAETTRRTVLRPLPSYWAGLEQAAAYTKADLRDVALRMDQRLRRHQVHVRALGGDESERFATAALINVPTHDAAEGRDIDVELVNCGHLTPLAVGPDGVRTLTGDATLPLGMLGLTGETPASDLVPVRAGETLLLVSDGVTEARDADGAFYPLSDDLTSALRDDPALSEPRRLVRYVRAAAARHAANGLTDDTTVLAVRHSPGQGA